MLSSRLSLLKNSASSMLNLAYWIRSFDDRTAHDAGRSKTILGQSCGFLWRVQGETCASVIVGFGCIPSEIFIVSFFGTLPDMEMVAGGKKGHGKA
jgi:hypothetical protein